MLNKLILRAFLSISLALSFTGAANATLISQDILFDTMSDDVDEFKVIGNITINLDTIDDFGSVKIWESFTFYDYEADVLADKFETIVDVNNIAAGIQFLDFDVTVFSKLSFSGIIDSYNSTNSVAFSVFDNATAGLFDAGALAFGDVNVIPTPATLVLLLTAVAGLAARRKKSNL
jgi:hypothetical protein